MLSKEEEKEIERQQEKSLKTILELRERNFSKGLPFLYLSDKLPAGQSYHEYADGRIELLKLVTVKGESDFKLVRVLSKKEADLVRKQTGYFTQAEETKQRKKKSRKP